MRDSQCFYYFAAESKNIGKMRHLFVIIITLLMLQPIYVKQTTASSTNSWMLP